jgi:hypothetical protein
VDAFFIVDDIRRAGLAGNSLHGTVPGALAAALAQLGLNFQAALAAVAHGAVVVYHMVEIFLPEVAQGAEHRLAGALPQAAQGGGGDGVGKALQQVKILDGAFIGHDPV